MPAASLWTYRVICGLCEPGTYSRTWSSCIVLAYFNTTTPWLLDLRQSRSRYPPVSCAAEYRLHSGSQHVAAGPLHPRHRRAGARGLSAAAAAPSALLVASSAVPPRALPSMVNADLRPLRVRPLGVLAVPAAVRAVPDGAAAGAVAVRCAVSALCQRALSAAAQRGLSLSAAVGGAHP